MIVAVWVIALVFNFHYLVIAQLHTIDKGVKNCRVHYPTPESNLAAIIFMDFNLFIMPLGIMTVLYGIVIKTLWTGMQLEKMGNDRQSLNGQ